VPEELALITFREAGAPDWYDGIVCDAETPPPPAPDSLAFSFQTFWVGAGPRAVISVPPTPVTNGWLAGSSTARAFVPQSSEPESPAAAKIDWPWVAACWKSVPSSLMTEAPAVDSQSPHDVETTLAVSLSTICS
jgi:hypothetical protein